MYWSDCLSKVLIMDTVCVSTCRVAYAVTVVLHIILIKYVLMCMFIG